MGLEFVELIMEVEDSFGIQISNDQAAELQTVGDLYALVLEKTRVVQRKPNRGVTAATFYELRKKLITLSSNMSSIRPSTEIPIVFPWHRRRMLSKRLSQEMGLRFPALCRPGWLTLIGYCVVTCLTVSVFYSQIPAGIVLSVARTISICLISCALFLLLTRPFAVDFDIKTNTIRGLVERLVALNFAKLSQQFSTWNATDIWCVLQKIIAQQINVDKKTITPDANFLSDLRMN